jgi:hypothetical protein
LRFSHSLVFTTSTPSASEKIRTLGVFVWTTQGAGELGCLNFYPVKLSCVSAAKEKPPSFLEGLLKSIKFYAVA